MYESRYNQRSGNGFEATMKQMIMGLGVVLVIVGGIVMIYLALTVFQIIEDPAGVPLIEFTMDKVGAGSKAIFGTLNDTASNDSASFDIHLSESVRMMFFLFVSIMIFGAFAKIIKVVMATGMELIKMSMGDQYDELKEKVEGVTENLNDDKY